MVVGCFFFILIQISMEHSISKQWRPWSDATERGVWSGSHCLPMSHKRTLGLYGLTTAPLWPLGMWPVYSLFTISIAVTPQSFSCTYSLQSSDIAKFAILWDWSDLNRLYNLAMCDINLHRIFETTLRGYIFQKLLLAWNFSCINKNCFFNQGDGYLWPHCCINNLYIFTPPTYNFWAIGSMLISLFRVTSWFDTVWNIVTRWVNFRENHLHEHELQLSDYNI